MQSNSIPSCSKAPRGLSVFPRVASIFAGATISPSPSLRQHRDRYAFRAGRKLPDKEFRYHRTVMVTAVVHQAFGSGREPFPLSVWHWTGVSPYTSACALAETCVFGKQSPRSFHCNPSQLRRQHNAASSPVRALLLPKLRSQFAEFLNEGSLARLRILSLPTCVGLGYGHRLTFPRGFSWQYGVNHFVAITATRHNLSGVWMADLPTIPSQAWPHTSNRADGLPFCVPPSVLASDRWCRNIDLLSIAYGFRPRLRPD